MKRTPAYFRDPLDEMLLGVAFRIQLPAEDYRRAREHYEAVWRHIERPGSPFADDQVERFYPQGSMAIGAAIASGTSDDKFDVDAVAQVATSPTETARAVLDGLYEAVRGEPGSQYYRVTTRRTRCVTIKCDRDMHLDVTPARRLPGTWPRESWIYHHQEHTPGDGDHLVANPHGFAEWFKSKIEEDRAFAEAYAARYDAYRRLVAEAEVEPLPEPPPLLGSPRVVVLQLLKRWKNIQYDGAEGRIPPSVLLAKLVAEARITSPRLAGMLLDAAMHLLTTLERAQNRGRLIHEENPVCDADVLTDRWPDSALAQRVFAGHLRRLVGTLRELVSGSPDLDQIRRSLIDLFGERPTTNALAAYRKRTLDPIRRGRGRHQPGSGRIVAAGVGAGSVARPTRATPSHNFYGSDE